MSNNVDQVNDGSFEQVVLRSDKPVLVDFWAEWCGPCRRLAPTIEALAQRYAGTARVVKVNIEDGQLTAGRYGLLGVPTLILFKDGVERERIVGAVDGEAIGGMIERHTPALRNVDVEDRSN